MEENRKGVEKGWKRMEKVRDGKVGNGKGDGKGDRKEMERYGKGMEKGWKKDGMENIYDSVYRSKYPKKQKQRSPLSPKIPPSPSPSLSIPDKSRPPATSTSSILQYRLQFERKEKREVIPQATN